MPKFDGVIEAVRYKSGKIEVVRCYERRGATFSDHVLLSRKALLDRLINGKHFVTGQRKQYLASTFEIGKSVNVAGTDGSQVVTTLPQHDHDELEGIPAF